MTDINESKQTVIFHERIEPLLEIYEDDHEAFGRIMHGLFSYSLYGEIIELPDKRENCDLKLLRNMVDQGRQSNRKYIVNQTIKSNLKVATSEDDMAERLRRKGFDEEEVQQGVDRYRQKMNEEAGLDSSGQFPAGTSWDVVDRYRNR